MAFWNRQEEKVPPSPEMNRKMREKFYQGEDEEGPILEEQATGEEDERGRALQMIRDLANALVEKRDKAVSARASCGIEEIWREDELAFEGLDEATLRTRMLDYAQEIAPARGSGKTSKRSQVVFNIVRPKCETAEGRFSDIQLPTDGKNWGLKVTPVPELVKAMEEGKNVPAVHPEAAKAGARQIYNNPDEEGVSFEGKPNGKPATMADVAKSDKEIAERKMKLMEAEINDQLTECGYNGECRKVIQSAVRLGTGILKGPIIVKDVKKTWRKVEGENTTVRVLSVDEDHRPASKSVDPWDVFPDPECRGDVRRAGYIWERNGITPRELRDLVGLDGYLEDQIMEVLLEQPQTLSVARDKDNNYVIKYNLSTGGSSYETWEYNGDVNREDLEALGCDCGDGKFPSMSANIIMVNDRPIKATLNPIDTGDLPYDFFTWTSRGAVPWGIGLARELMWTSRVLIAAWRAMMDNAGDSSGANIVLGANVDPMDDRWEITGKKLWKTSDDSLDIRKQFGQFQLKNNQAELQAIIELALRFADMDSQLPMLFQGEKGELPQTLGATNVIVDSANVALRARVKLWDDDVTRPHITRYYDWNMQYSEDDEIKGDYKVDPRGTTYLLERDQEAQKIEEVLALRADPELAMMIDWPKAVEKMVSARKMDILLPADKIKENLENAKKQPPPPDPALEAARIRAEAELQKAQLVQEADMRELQFKSQEAGLDRQHQAQMKVMDREIKMMELSQASGISLDKIKAELTITAQKLNTQVALAKDKNVVPAEQIATPIAEPGPRAKAGHAFQD